MFFATSGVTFTGTVTLNTPTADDPATPAIDDTRMIHTGRNHVAEGDTFQWIRFYSGNAKGHVARVILHDGFLEGRDEVEILGSPNVRACFFVE